MSESENNNSEALQALPPGIESVDVAEDTNTIVFEIGQRHTIRMTPTPEGFEVRVKDNGTLIAHTTAARDWYKDRNKKGRLGNILAADVSAFTKTDMKSRVRKIAAWMIDADERIGDQLRNPDATDILVRTEGVVEHDLGDDMMFVIEFEAPDDGGADHNAEMVLREDDWFGNPTNKIDKWHYRTYQCHRELMEEDWTDLRESWEERSERVTSDAEPEEMLVAKRVIAHLRRTLSGNIFESEEKAGAQQSNALYESAEDSEYDEATVWVRSIYLQDILADHTDKKQSYSRQLRSTLDRQGVIIENQSKRPRLGGDRPTLYPFSLDELDLTEADVEFDDDDPATEVPEP